MLAATFKETIKNCSLCYQPTILSANLSAVARLPAAYSNRPSPVTLHPSPFNLFNQCFTCRAMQCSCNTMGTLPPQRVKGGMQTGRRLQLAAEQLPPHAQLSQLLLLVPPSSSCPDSLLRSGGAGSSPRPAGSPVQAREPKTRRSEQARHAQAEAGWLSSRRASRLSLWCRRCCWHLPSVLQPAATPAPPTGTSSY